MTDAHRVFFYDTSLRDGGQMRGISFGVRDKQIIADLLDTLGVDYIEAGFPGANPVDTDFFADLPPLKHARFVGFGMTRRAKLESSTDASLQAVLGCNAPAVCLVGKAWDFQVTEALGIPLETNLSMIEDSIRAAVTAGKEVIFDAEHALDGFKNNPAYMIEALVTAHRAGARWIVLCDTNGGSLPKEIQAAVESLSAHIPHHHLGIHCHNDADLATANSLAAIEAGARMVQGTINGIGERCGNANLIPILATLAFKYPHLDLGVAGDHLEQLTPLSRSFDDVINRIANPHAAYVGSAAFAHKGGLHISAIQKNSALYEHIDPARVGNQRDLVMSQQAGRAAIMARCQRLGLSVEAKAMEAFLEELKRLESLGYSFDGADASFDLLARRRLSPFPPFYTLRSFRVIDERRWNAKGELITLSEATVKMDVGDTHHMAVAEGNGPVNALDRALRTVLSPFYPEVNEIRLIDYKVRILTPTAGTEALTRVTITSKDHDDHVWTTVGVSGNVIDASCHALQDSLMYFLMRGVGGCS